MRSSAIRLIFLRILRSPILRILLFLPLGLLGTASASAQDPGRIGSRILSVDSWTYEAIERLRIRAYLPGLNPLAQPYRRIDVAVELIGVDADTLGEPVAGWVRMPPWGLVGSSAVRDAGPHADDPTACRASL